MKSSKTPASTPPEGKSPLKGAPAGVEGAASRAAADEENTFFEATQTNRGTGGDGAVMVRRAMVWQNVSLAFAALLLWGAWRFLYIRANISGGVEWKFKKYDVMFIVLVPCAAFCLNWYWLREQRTDVITKWSTGWGVFDLVFLLACVLAAQHFGLHGWMMALSAER